MDKEGYEYFKAEVLKEPEKPCFMAMADDELAKEYFDEIKKDIPGTRIYFRDKQQIVCTTSESRRELVVILEKQRQKQEESIRRIEGLIDTIRAQEGDIWKRRS